MDVEMKDREEDEEQDIDNNDIQFEDISFKLLIAWFASTRKRACRALYLSLEEKSHLQN